MAWISALCQQIGHQVAAVCPPACEWSHADRPPARCCRHRAVAHRSETCGQQCAGTDHSQIYGLLRGAADHVDNWAARGAHMSSGATQLPPPAQSLHPNSAFDTYHCDRHCVHVGGHHGELSWLWSLNRNGAVAQQHPFLEQLGTVSCIQDQNA